MRKEKKFTESEYTLNPLYRKMKERFSVEGQVTIGDFMRNRARRDGYTVRGYEMPAAPAVAVAAPEKVPATPLRTPALESAPACKKKDSHPSFFKRHMTFFACFALFLCIALTLSVIIPVWTNFSASAGNDGISDMPGGSATAPEATPNPEPETPHSSFENVMSAFND